MYAYTVSILDYLQRWWTHCIFWGTWKTTQLSCGQFCHAPCSLLKWKGAKALPLETVASLHESWGFLGRRYLEQWWKKTKGECNQTRWHSHVWGNIMDIRVLKCAHFFIVTAFADLYLVHLFARLYSFLEKDKCADIQYLQAHVTC